MRLRGYRELHVRAFKLLSTDGLLATFSCSHHVSEAVFDQTIADALVDARRSARRLRRSSRRSITRCCRRCRKPNISRACSEMMPGR